MKHKITYLLTLLLIASCNSQKQLDYSEPSHDSQIITKETLEQSEKIQSQLYEAKSTDTLISVARIHNTTPQALVELNNFQKPYTIRAGQLIKIPIFSTEDTTPSGEQRVVHISPTK